MLGVTICLQHMHASWVFLKSGQDLAAMLCRQGGDGTPKRQKCTFRILGLWLARLTAFSAFRLLGCIPFFKGIEAHGRSTRCLAATQYGALSLRCGTPPLEPSLCISRLASSIDGHIKGLRGHHAAFTTSPSSLCKVLAMRFATWMTCSSLSISPRILQVACYATGAILKWPDDHHLGSHEARY